MMTGKDDDATSIREDSFLAELVPQAAEHLAGQHAGDYDAADGRARFQSWLAGHTERPVSPAPGEIQASTRHTRREGSHSPDASSPASRHSGRGLKIAAYLGLVKDGHRDDGSWDESPAGLAHLTTLHPRTYSDVRAIGEHFRAGTPVIMNLTGMTSSDAKRLVDFSAGLVFALRGSIDRVTDKVFLLSPASVEVTAGDKARITEHGTGEAEEALSERASGAHADMHFLTVSEVAEIMRLPKMMVYRLVHSGELEAIRVGHSFRVLEETVIRYMANSDELEATGRPRR